MNRKHFHFVQSLEPLQGAGLGGSALGLHLGMLNHRIGSRLVATKASNFEHTWPEVYQGVRRGPERIFYSPFVHRHAHEWVSYSDVVHGHGFYVSSNWIFGREVARQKKPLVYHIQGFLDPWILRRSRLKKRLAHWLFENRNFRNVRLWRAITQKEVHQARAFGITGPVVVAPNGIDPASLILPAQCTLPRKTRMRILFLSRIHPKKGLDLLLAAWARLAPQHKEWELLIVGPDENGYQSEVERMIRENHIGDTCRLMGAVFGEEKTRILHTADLFVLSSYSEGFPMALLEAGACGIPAVATTECNFPELFEVGGGWECEPQIESLTSSFDAALSASDSERRQRGEAARRLISEKYTWESVTKTIIDACELHCS
jgi:glycosyltransferase involved in cell wall biosynthesis